LLYRACACFQKKGVERSGALKLEIIDPVVKKHGTYIQADHEASLKNIDRFFGQVTTTE